MPARADIIRAAREYLGTPYRHQGRIKGKGLDCIGLALCTATDLGLTDKTGEKFYRYLYADYARQPMGEQLQEECIRRLIVKSIGVPASLSGILPGDVLTLRVPSIITHLAIVSDMGYTLGMIHSYASVRNVVIEHLIDEKWRRRIAGVFSFPGVD